MTFLDFVGHVSFFLGAVSSWIRDELWLRALLIVSFLVGIVYNATLASGPLWVVIFWLAVFVLINAWRIFTTWREKRGAIFTDDERELYDMEFFHFTPIEFKRLMRIAQWKTGAAKDVLHGGNEPWTDLMFVYEGEGAVQEGDRDERKRRSGAFVGDMALLDKDHTPRRVEASLPTRYVTWRKAELLSLLNRFPSMKLAFATVMNYELLEKYHLDLGEV